MKRFLLLSVVIVLMGTAVSVKAGGADLSGLTGLTGDEVRDRVDPVAGCLAAVFGTGLFSPVSGKVFSAGITVNAVATGGEGWITNLGVPLLPVPFVYIGVRLPMVGVSLFGRGAFLPFSAFGIGTNDALILGFGAGWDRTFFTKLNVRILAHYHMARNFTFFDSDSAGLTVLASYVKIRQVKPFVLVGFENTWVRVPLLTVPPETGFFRMSRPSCRLGVGAALFRILCVEADVLPRFSVSLSVGYAH